MKEPNLMPFQDAPFNGDEFIEQEFLKLKHRFDIEAAVETGTCLGSTTLFLANNFEKVFTVEINKEYLRIALQKFISHKNINTYLGDSPTILSTELSKLSNKTIFFLDAHYLAAKDNRVETHCPLLDELAAIANAGLKPIITIHDMKVPGEPQLGFDFFSGQPFTLEWIRPELDSIYGVGSYEYYYNSDEKSQGAKRGIIYITPK